MHHENKINLLYFDYILISNQIKPIYLLIYNILINFNQIYKTNIKTLFI